VVLAERRRDPKVIATSFIVGAAVKGVLMLVFGRLLQVPLPTGALFD
jgi:fructose-specific phosphotransferase system IIC component